MMYDELTMPAFITKEGNVIDIDNMRYHLHLSCPMCRMKLNILSREQKLDYIVIELECPRCPILKLTIEVPDIELYNSW